MFSISNDCYIIGDIFVWFRVAIEIRLESYSPRHASVVLWNDIVLTNHLEPIVYKYNSTQLHLTTKLTYVMTAYYIPNDGFTANDASFYKNKVG